MEFSEAVASLGTTPEEVTAVLRAKGIKGNSCVASSCPVAKYLESCGFASVTVCKEACRYTSRSENEPVERLLLPEGVQQWIRKFDDGQYPEFKLI